MKQSTHLPQFDWLRVALFPIGIFLHCFFTFTSYHYMWWTSDFSVPLHFIVWVTHLFRMPIFMMIAGFFSQMSLEKESVDRFLRARTKRIFVPFLLAYAILMPPTNALLYWRLPAIVHSAATTPLATLMSQSYAQFFAGQLHPHHLWFLVYLSWYTLLFSIVNPFRSFFSKWAPRGLMTLIPLGIVTSSLTLWLNNSWWDVGYVSISLWPKPAPFLYYGFFFFAGALMRKHSTLNQEVVQSCHQLLAVALAGIVLAAFGPTLSLHFPSWRIDNFLMEIVALTMIAASFGIYGFFWRHLTVNSPIIRRCADASLWVYIIHVPIIASLEYLIGSKIQNPFMAYAFLAPTALTLSVLSYFIQRAVKSWFLNTFKSNQNLPIVAPIASGETRL